METVLHLDRLAVCAMAGDQYRRYRFCSAANVFSNGKIGFLNEVHRHPRRIRLSGMISISLHAVATSFATLGRHHWTKIDLLIFRSKGFLYFRHGAVHQC